jgi:hypothetical protein
MIEINSNRKQIIHSNYFVAPPTYEECMFGTTSITDADDSEHVLGTTGYNPRYPTYTLETSVPSTPAIGWATLKA